MDVLSIFKPALYPINTCVDEEDVSPPKVFSLVDLCCRKIVQDSTATNLAIQVRNSKYF